LLLCSECHRHIESHRTEALLEGFLVLQIASPAKAAVKYRGQYVFLDDRGNLLEVAA
jgi:5-methylcytosine-specific restriction protein A